MSSGVQMKTILKLATVLFISASLSGCSDTPQAVDLGKVLDRTALTLTKYQSFLAEKKIAAAGDEQAAQFSGFLNKVMNGEPRFYNKPIAVDLLKDGSFLGYEDKNTNQVQDSGENQLFTVVVDGQKKRLIATDIDGKAVSQEFTESATAAASGASGASGETRGSGSGFSGGGLMTGMFLGMLLSRQRGAGIAPGAFSSRTATPRSSYTAPRSARTSSRSSSRSRSRSGGVSRGK
jgi:hypothetical protein